MMNETGNALTETELAVQYYARLAQTRTEEIEQLRAELAQICIKNNCLIERSVDNMHIVRNALGIEAKGLLPIVEAIRKLRAELAQARVELKDLQEANREYGRQLAAAKENREYWYQAWLAAARERNEVLTELAQTRAELAAVDESLGGFCCPVLDPETDEPCGSFYADHGVNVMRQALEMAEHVAAEAGLEAEGLRRQLEQAEAHVASVAQAVEWLWGFWDGNTLVAKSGYIIDIIKAWDKLLKAVGTPVAAQLLDRLATLDAAEAALANCGITGIYDEFSCLTDAIMQMSAHIKELEGEPVEVEIMDTEMAEVLQNERQERIEAEQCHRAVLALAQDRWKQLEEAGAELKRGHQTLTHLSIPLNDENGRLPLTGRIERMAQTLFPERELRREAEKERDWWCREMQESEKRHMQTRVKLARAKAERDEASGNLKRMVELNEWSRNELDRVGKQAERAEALAALVTPEVAALLENMASCCREYADVREPADKLHPSRGYVMSYRRDAKNARALAAEIREALEENDETA